MYIELSLTPEYGARGFHVVHLQQRLKDLGYDPNGIDGIFGQGTVAALKKFQQSAPPLQVTGKADGQTLAKLNLSVKNQEPDPEIAISDIVDQSGIAMLGWANRGTAVWGYYHGMALVFATLYTRLKAGDAVAKELAKGLQADADRDALKRFDDVFSSKGMRNAGPETDRLRHLFVLMMGLGVMESNGKYCVGKDSTQTNNHGADTEAGLFQTSYDIRGNVNDRVKKMLDDVFASYKAAPREGFLSYFSMGFKNFTTDSLGKGDAYDFQELEKKCPAFAAEYAALALRNVTNHWQPVRDKDMPKRTLEIKPECDKLLQQVQSYVDNHPFASNKADTHIVAAAAAAAPADSMAQTGYDEQMLRALASAVGVGQEPQLRALFNKHPESKANYWAVVDFNKPSNEKRLFIFDLRNDSYDAYLVAHGKNSGEGATATVFSNTNGSNQSSLGIYKAAEEYQGIHGKSLRIDGLESSNSSARDRDIVIHSADYVTDTNAGHSLGCFVVNKKYIDEVVDHLKSGSYLYAWHTGA